MDTFLAWSKRAIAVLLALATSGCFLTLMLGRASLGNATIHANANTAHCRESSVPSPRNAVKPLATFTNCWYFIEGGLLLRRWSSSANSVFSAC